MGLDNKGALSGVLGIGESNPAGLVFGCLLFINLVFIFWSLLGASL